MKRVFLLLLLLYPQFAIAALSVIDDSGREVKLFKPAGRIISLAPHATELLYAAGAATKLVGVVAFSDFPPEAKQLPQVGDAHALDLERILALRPDLVVAWDSGNNPAQVAQLERAGIPVFRSEPRRLEDVAASIERLAVLIGRPGFGQAAARDMRQELAVLTEKYRNAAPVSVFYEIWREPLMTLNGQHIISDALGRCGARNIFAGLAPLTPAVSVESVLAARPEVIAGSFDADSRLAWQKWTDIPAVRAGNFCAIDSSRMHRSGPRLVSAARDLCACIDAARQRLPVK